MRTNSWFSHGLIVKGLRCIDLDKCSTLLYSSSTDSSDDSGKEYDEVSINDARDHVMKKLRNKLKRKYVKGK